MALYQRDEYTEKHKRGPGFGFLLSWVAANIAGNITGTAIARPIFVWQPEGFLSFVDSESVGALCLGLFVGVAQALVLLSYLKLAGGVQWVLATALGRIVRVILISALTTGLIALFPGSISFEVPAVLCGYLLVHAFIGACAGAATGYVQRFVLANRVAFSQWWVWVNAGTSAYIMVITAINTGSYNVFSRIADGTFYLFLTSAIPSLFTGYVLLDLLRHPTSKAEWTIHRRKERTLPPTYLEPQKSPDGFLDPNP